MSALKDKLKKTMSLISTERDIVNLAKIRAESKKAHIIPYKHLNNQQKNEKEMKFVMKKRKIIMSAATAAAAVVIAGGTAYAASPEVRETVNSILGINRKTTQDYYKIFDDDSSENEENAKVIENDFTVTENDFTDFAEGIRTKLVSVANSGSFAEVLLEFEFDKPVKEGEYTFDGVSISSYPEYLPGYSYGALTVSENGRIYGTVHLKDTENIPEDMTMTMEIKALKKTIGDDTSDRICGNFSADFTLGTPIKPYSANVEPAEISYTHPRMGGETAHMEITDLKYSPMKISVDLRMLEDCLVDYNDEHGGAAYLNNTEMFVDAIMGYTDAPLKFKMSDGSLKNVCYINVSSNAVVNVDKSTLVTDMDWIRASWNIYSDKPATVTFELAGITDYSDVEAIVFCGKEFSITEKDF